MKKITALLLVLIISISVFSVNASAFGGYAHWYMGVKKGDSYGNTKSDEVKLAYASGCLLADIGKYGLDLTKAPESDSYEFTRKIYSVSRDLNTRSRCMAYGWRDHYVQDRKGSLALTNPPATTLSSAGWVDEYLRDVWKPIDFPIQDKELGEIYIGYTLIRRTYEQYGVILDKNSDVDREIKNLLGKIDFQIGLNVVDWKPAQEEAIKSELHRTVNLCTGITAGVPQEIRSTSLSENVSGIDKSFSEYQASIKKTRTDVVMNSITDDELSEITKYIHFEKDYISEDEAILKIRKTDEEAYNAAVKDLIEYKIDNYSELVAA